MPASVYASGSENRESGRLVSSSRLAAHIRPVKLCAVSTLRSLSAPEPSADEPTHMASAARTGPRREPASMPEGVGVERDKRKAKNFLTTKNKKENRQPKGGMGGWEDTHLVKQKFSF